jgi:hypothetical protein
VRRNTVAAVAAVVGIAVTSGCAGASGDPAAGGSSSAATTTSAPTDPSTAAPTSTAAPKREGAAARVPREVILHQLARVAERIAKHVPMTAPTPVDVSPGTNRALGFHLLVQFGFAADQWKYLDALWTRESGWNELAENPSSGAYGIPQSLPATKMAVVGRDWRTNPDTQIRWGLAYIAARYGNPQGAWAHSERFGWY